METIIKERTAIKRVAQCGACNKWYRRTRMYHVYFAGNERIVTAVGVVDNEVNKQRLVCPKCYREMGYKANEEENIDVEDIEFSQPTIIADPNFISQEQILFNTKTDGSIANTDKISIA